MTTKRVRADELRPGDVSHGITVATITPMVHVVYATGSSRYLLPGDPVTVDVPEPTVDDYRAAIEDLLKDERYHYTRRAHLLDVLRVHGIELDQ
jgi:hypothetical protein